MTATNLALQTRASDVEQVATATVDQCVAHDRLPQLSHHFDTMPQQYEAAKLGMWLFLATEVLLFGGLFCLYAVYRAGHPDIFAYGSQFLDTTWGAINTGVLIVSSLTMAMAVWCAQNNYRRGLCLFLGLTLLCAIDFLGIKWIEYSHKFHDNLVWGVQFYEGEHAGDRVEDQEVDAGLAAIAALEPGDPARGGGLYLRTCMACHGLTGEGLPGLGKPLQTSEFVAGLDDASFVAFLIAGRSPKDPLNTTGAAMLPRGGNPSLRDQDLMDIVAHVRILQTNALTATSDERGVADGKLPIVNGQLLLPQSVIPLAPDGPSGLAWRPDESDRNYGILRSSTNAAPTALLERPANAHLFFAIYFGMTGLHGLHVLAGIGVITWLLIRALKGHFDNGYFTPVDLGGLYWHIVDVIWIFLFPLLYLIR